MSLPKKVLLAITSAHEAFYPDGAKTGLYWSEAVHPYHVFTKAGFEVQFVSETGSYGIDDHSIAGAPFISDEDLAEYKDKSQPIHKAFKDLKKASEVKASDYGVFFAAGGHGCLFDFPKARALQDLAQDIYQNGGIVSAVCHGPAILEDIVDKSTGELLVKGKKVTGFTDAGEVEFGVQESIDRLNLHTLEPFYSKAGAKYIAPSTTLASQAVTDGRLVTGANPASAEETAKQVVEAFKSL